MTATTKSTKKAPAKKKTSAKKQGRVAKLRSGAAKLFSNIKSKLNRETLHSITNILVSVALIVIATHLISEWLF